MSFIQNLIHKTEVAGGSRYIKPVLAGLSLLILVSVYHWRCYKNIWVPEAMDAAQVGRNLSEGKGYTTQFVRPFSMYLVQRRNLDKFGPQELGKRQDFARIKDSPHPDISNPPVYPVVLAALMKVLPFHYQVNTTDPFWSVVDPRFTQTHGRRAWRHQPDFLIAVF